MRFSEVKIIDQGPDNNVTVAIRYWPSESAEELLSRQIVPIHTHKWLTPDGAEAVALRAWSKSGIKARDGKTSALLVRFLRDNGHNVWSK